MASFQSDSEGFIALWPTLLLQRRLPGHGPANGVLVELIGRLERDNPNLTTDYRQQNFLGLDNPAVAWLHECVNRTVIAYLRRAGIDYPLQWSLQAWPNVNRFGDYHDLHNHPFCYLSGTYYARVPRSRESLRGRADLRPGAISFYDPRGAANMTAIRGDPNVDPELTIEPEEGLLLLWPSFLMHLVHPNLSREPRISISFNVILRDPGACLPDQAAG